MLSTCCAKGSVMIVKQTPYMRPGTVEWTWRHHRNAKIITCAMFSSEVPVTRARKLLRPPLLEKPNIFKPFPCIWHLQIICFWQSHEINSYITFSCKNSKMQIMWQAPSCINQATENWFLSTHQTGKRGSCRRDIMRDKIFRRDTCDLSLWHSCVTAFHSNHNDAWNLLFQKAFMNKNLYKFFFSSSSASCVQWHCKRFDPGEKISRKGPLVIVRGFLANTQKKIENSMWLRTYTGYIFKPWITRKYSEKRKRATTYRKPKLY